MTENSHNFSSTNLFSIKYRHTSARLKWHCRQKWIFYNPHSVCGKLLLLKCHDNYYKCKFVKLTCITIASLLNGQVRWWCNIRCHRFYASSCSDWNTDTVDPLTKFSTPRWGNETENFHESCSDYLFYRPLVRFNARSKKWICLQHVWIRDGDKNVQRFPEKIKLPMEERDMGASDFVVFQYARNWCKEEKDVLCWSSWALFFHVFRPRRCKNKFSSVNIAERINVCPH